MIRAWMVPFRDPSIIEWCAQVTVNPDVSKTMVFSRGISNGSSGLIPLGGHWRPRGCDGLRLKKKKVQKNPKKNRTSDVINRIIP